MKQKKIALLGGSFNPPHIGHFRLAHEVIESLNPTEVTFVPCATPPHKTTTNLLPFDFRVELLKAYTDSQYKMSVSTIENERQGPSYTIDTLRELHLREQDVHFLFIMGEDDVVTLPTWKEWQILPLVADLIVLPRSDTRKQHFEETLKNLWPNFSVKEIYTGMKQYSLQGGGCMYHIDQPTITISSTLLRHRFIKEQNLDLLLPSSILTLLNSKRTFVKKLWCREFSDSIK